MTESNEINVEKVVTRMVAMEQRKARELEKLRIALSPFFDRQWRKQHQSAEKIVAVKDVPIKTEFGESSSCLVIEYQANREKPFVLCSGFKDFIGSFATAKETLSVVSQIEELAIASDERGSR